MLTRCKPRYSYVLYLGASKSNALQAKKLRLSLASSTFTHLSTAALTPLERQKPRVAAFGAAADG
jgi:hypothetical protein